MRPEIKIRHTCNSFVSTASVAPIPITAGSIWGSPAKLTYDLVKCLMHIHLVRQNNPYKKTLSPFRMQFSLSLYEALSNITTDCIEMNEYIIKHFVLLLPEVIHREYKFQLCIWAHNSITELYWSHQFYGQSSVWQTNLTFQTYLHGKCPLQVGPCSLSTAGATRSLGAWAILRVFSKIPSCLWYPEVQLLIKRSLQDDYDLWFLGLSINILNQQ